MNRYLLLAVSFICSFVVLAQSGAKNTNWSVKPFERKAFIEYKNQLDNLLPKSNQKFDYCIDNKSQVLFSNDGLLFVIKKYNHKKLGLKALFLSEEKREQLEREVDVDLQYISVKWLNSNPNAKIEVSDLQSTSYNYLMRVPNGKNYTELCKGFSKLVYKNLYKGIDVEYFFTEKEGFKYNIIAQAGADLSQIKMQYDSHSKVSINSEGDVVVKTIKGDFIDHAPVSYLTSNQNEQVKSSFQLEKNIISFNVHSSGKESITIDPWTLTPGLGGNPAYDNGIDGSGNLYLYGGVAAAGNVCEKYALNGTTPLWSLTNGAVGEWTPGFGYYYGDLLVESAGTFYLSEGAVSPGAHTYKFNTNSGLIWTSNADANYNEHWRLALNCITNKVIVSGGGTTVPTNNIAEIDVNTGNLTNIKAITGHNDMSGLCVDETGKSYMHSANINELFFNDASNNLLGQTPSGYNHSELAIAPMVTPTYYSKDTYNEGIGNGYNMMTLGGATFLFTNDGAVLKKWDRNTMALLGSVNIPGGSQNMGGGILADNCNNVWVGSVNGVYRYDFNLTQQQVMTTPSAVYDIAFSGTGDIMACGNGFATELTTGRITCGSTVAQVITDPCNPAINSVTVSATGGIAPYTYTWDDAGTGAIRNNLTPGWHIVVIKDANCIPLVLKDSVEVKSTGGIQIETIKACPGSNAGQIKFWLTNNKDITTFSFSPSATTNQINDSTVIVTGLVAGSYSVHVTSIDLPCDLDTVINLPSIPQLTVNVTELRKAKCPGELTGSAKAFVTGGQPYLSSTHTDYNFSWNSTPLQTDSILKNVSNGNYIVSVTDSLGCTGSGTVNIGVGPLPIPSFITNTVCVGAQTSFTNTSTITTGSIVAYGWAFGGMATVPTPTSNLQNPTFTYTNCSAINNATLVAVSDSGCVAFIVNPVAVHCLPVANFTVSNSCQNDLVQFTSTSSNGVGTIGSLIYNWNLNPITSALQNPTQTYSTTGTISVSVTVTDVFGCKDSVTKPVTIYALPKANFTSDSACYNNASNMLDASNGNGNTITGYVWDFDSNGTVDNTTSNPSNIFPLVGNNLVSYTVITTPVSGLTCSSDTTQNVWVRSSPTADFSVTSVCKGISTMYTDITSSTNGTVSTWGWDFANDGTIDNTTQNPTFLFNSPGTYTTALIISTSSGCKDTVKKQVTVYGHSIPDFLASNLCFGSTNNFTNTTTTNTQPNTGTVNTWNWNFNDNSTSSVQNPSHVYSNLSNAFNNTTYSVQLTVTTSNGCKDSVTKPVTIYALPTANFTSDSVCFNSPSHLMSTSNGNGNPITSHSWDFTGDNIADVNGPSNINYTMPLLGNNLVNYTVTSNPAVGLTCKTATSVIVYTYPNPTADFNFVNKCINAQPNTFDASISNTSVGTIVNYAWNFGDGQTSNNTLATATNNYSLATLYNVTLTVTTNKGCVHSTTKQVEVYEKPLVNIVSQDKVCFGSTTTFTAQTLPNSGVVTSWLWDTNTNLNTIETNGQQSNYTFNVEGTHTLNLIASTDKGCKDTLTRTVYVNYNPKPEFTVDKNSGCTELCVTFSDLTPTLTAPSTVNNWQWSFGNGIVDTPVNTNQPNCYTNLNSGSVDYYDISLTVQTDSGCVAAITKTNYIAVYPKPVANYTIVPDLGNVVAPQVHFENQSIDYTKWYWTFGDGSKIDSTHVNPSHTYTTTEANQYYSQLIVANQYGCKDTAQLLVDIAPEFVFYIPNAFTPNEDGINDGFIGVGIGIAKYEMWIYERWGTTVYYTDDITKPWYGKVQGKQEEAPQNVYTWKVELKDIFGKKHNYVGHVTLLR